MINLQLHAYNTIEVTVDNNIATLWLNRPEVHNAFNPNMVTEIISAMEVLGKEVTLKVLVIRGKGKSFCAGADLHWMKEVIGSDNIKNITESKLLARCLQNIYHFPVPVISLGHGSVIGGGIGFMAAADFAICTKTTRFAFSEVTIGLVPAIISYFIIPRMGPGKARELMLTGSPFNAAEAEQWGLVNHAIDELVLDTYVSSLIDRLKKNSLQAMKNTKKLLLHSISRDDENDILTKAANIISEARLSTEGQEGMRAFVEKRQPNWG
jgi:methylglutaconyl-CoA hydratase